jgi:hypothetical protein
LRLGELLAALLEQLFGASILARAPLLVPLSPLKLFFKRVRVAPSDKGRLQLVLGLGELALVVRDEGLVEVRESLHLAELTPGCADGGLQRRRAGLCAHVVHVHAAVADDGWSRSNACRPEYLDLCLERRQQLVGLLALSV